MNDFDEYLVKARGRLAGYREIINGYAALADVVPTWTPVQSLLGECQTALTLLDTMQKRLERKLIITLLGPTGSGKSTLLNALAQNDGLSPMGINRPTTRDIVIVCKTQEDVEPVLEQIDPTKVSIQTCPSVAGLENVVLVDTPDMDSAESERHRPILEAVIGVSDVLVCVLNAENPKRRDTIVFLKPFVDRYPGHLLYVAVNRSDRLPENELKQTIIPEVKKHLTEAWKMPVASVFATSARSNLMDPQWPEGEQPLHRFNEFPRLRAAVFDQWHQANRFVDARVQRAEHLAKIIQKSVRDHTAGIAERLNKIRADILALETEARTVAITTWKQSANEMLIGIHAMVYQNLASRWWGPVGWLVALWARFLMAGAGLFAAFRVGNPVVQLWGLISSLIQYRKTRETVTEATAGGDFEPVVTQYRMTVQKQWPEIAQDLIAVGFHHSVRDTTTFLADSKALGQGLRRSWRISLETVMDKRATALSGFILQFIFNLPTVALMALFAYESVMGFLTHQSLGSGYFLHAGISILLVWVLSFVLLQVIVRFASGRSLLNRVFEVLLKKMGDGGHRYHHAAILKEIDILLQLAE